MGVQRHCSVIGEHIKKIQSFAENDLQEEALEQIRDSGFSYMSLGMISIKASRIISDVCKHTDYIIANLPTKAQGDALIAREEKSIYRELEKKRHLLFISD